MTTISKLFEKHFGTTQAISTWVDEEREDVKKVLFHLLDEKDELECTSNEEIPDGKFTEYRVITILGTDIKFIIHVGMPDGFYISQELYEKTAKDLGISTDNISELLIDLTKEH